MPATTAELVLGVVALIAVDLLYLLPTLVAARRNAAGLARIVQLHVFLGWTVVVWAYCLILALRRPPSRPATPPRPTAHRVRQERMPDWVRELPPHERTWRALPRDTAPLPLDDPEDR